MGAPLSSEDLIYNFFITKLTIGVFFNYQYNFILLELVNLVYKLFIYYFKTSNY